MFTDSISDFCTRIRNAHLVKKDKVEIPFSKVKQNLCQILKKEGYIQDYKVKQKTILINLKYDQDGQAAITNIDRVSKPGLRVYQKSRKLRKVLSGKGLAIVSTPRGLMTDTLARKSNLGGEIFFKVW